ncbi:MAG: NAD(P)/FAD-dependent oxidoreductase [Kofleriaceae bacterium]|nr:NAD(P)/FAD-dependent oxidoreductase [Kofleriaceae bacterium]
MDADVAIIGAGPAGTATALHLGQLGVKNVVLLDRHDFPRDKTCGSGVSPKGIEVLKALGVWDEVEASSYPINGLRLVTPGNREVFISGGGEAAAVICQRRTLDHLLLKRAQMLGTEFVPHFHAHELLMDDDRVVGVAAVDGRTVRARMTVVADGAHSRFTLQRTPKTVYQAIMGWWEDVPFTPNHVELVFDKMVSPMYGWLFPEGPTRVNIGIVYPDDDHQKKARQLFQAFLDKHYAKRLGAGSPVGKWQGHPVSYSFEIEKLTAPGRIVVGEAGRMTHPATAEGIYQGMKSGMLAAEALKELLCRERRESVALRRYEARCRSTFRVSLWASRLWLNVVSSRLLDAIVAMTQHRSSKNTLGRLIGNM